MEFKRGDKVLNVLEGTRHTITGVIANSHEGSFHTFYKYKIDGTKELHDPNYLRKLNDLELELPIIIIEEDDKSGYFEQLQKAKNQGYIPSNPQPCVTSAKYCIQMEKPLSLGS